METTTTKLYKQAKSKIMHSESLSRYVDFILADWPEGDAHLRWVIESTENEILEWVESSK